MTLEELRNEYGEKNVFENQYEAGLAAQELGIRNKVKTFCERFPNEKIKYDRDLIYDIAELLLQKSIMFFNDGYYIIEDFEYIKNI